MIARKWFIYLLPIAVFAAITFTAAEEPALKDLVPSGMLIGAAVNQRQSDGVDTTAVRIVTRHFNSVTPENLLKWQLVHPDPDRYAFDPVDRYVAFGAERGMAVIGHTLVWHQQTPKWVFANADGTPADRDTLLGRMRDHIQAVVGRYKGCIRGWDVVNEALEEDGSLRKSPWRDIIGDDFIPQAFQFAHEADPNAELYYNDYNLTKPDKRAGAVRLVRDLRNLGLRIDGVGEQGHWLIDTPSAADVDRTITELAATGVKVHITELDIDVLPRDPGMYGADLSKRAAFKASTNLYPDGLPPDVQQRLAARYADVFKVFLAHRAQLARVTFWGVTDETSWLNNFPVPGRVNHPLLWDRQGRAKPAFDSVVGVLHGAGGSR